jgi:hypothetical protein
MVSDVVDVLEKSKGCAFKMPMTPAGGQALVPREVGGLSCFLVSRQLLLPYPPSLVA